MFIEIEKKNEFQKTLDTLKHNKRRISFFYKFGHDWTDKTDFSLMEIFNLLAPELIIENSAKYCSKFLGGMLKPDDDKKIRQDWPTPSNTIRKILADLNVLDIIQPSTKKHSIKDENEYWSLTLEGKKIFKVVRRELLNQNLEQAMNDLEEEPQGDESTN